MSKSNIDITRANYSWTFTKNFPTGEYEIVVIIKVDGQEVERQMLSVVKESISPIRITSIYANLTDVKVYFEFDPYEGREIIIELFINGINVSNELPGAGGAGETNGNAMWGLEDALLSGENMIEVRVKYIADGEIYSATANTIFVKLHQKTICR